MARKTLSDVLREQQSRKPITKPAPVRDLYVAHDSDQDLWIGFVRNERGRFEYLTSMDSALWFVKELFFDHSEGFNSVTLVRGDIKTHSGLQRAYLAAQNK